MASVIAGHTGEDIQKQVLIGGTRWLQRLRMREEEAEVLMADVTLKNLEETQCRLKGCRSRKANFITTISPQSVLFYLTLGANWMSHKLLC